MPKRPATTRDARMRQRVTQGAARIMAGEAISGCPVATRKAAERLGAPDTRTPPTRRATRDALIAPQRLRGGAGRPALLRRLRQVAVEAMEFLRRFEPRLVGSVLHGTATEHSDVNLHVFAETPEEVAFFLMD